MDEVTKAIAFYEQLCEKRPGAAWWAENIVEASKTLTSHNNHANFYTYLADPEHFAYRPNIKTLQDLNEQELRRIDSELQELCVADQRTVVYENGTDRTLLITNGNEIPDDEKRDI